MQLDAIVIVAAASCHWIVIFDVQSYAIRDDESIQINQI